MGHHSFPNAKTEPSSQWGRLMDNIGKMTTVRTVHFSAQVINLKLSWPLEDGQHGIAA
jgi:hypothetical protein